MIKISTREGVNIHPNKRNDDDDDVDGAGLSAPAEEYPLEVVDSVGEAWG